MFSGKARLRHEDGTWPLRRKVSNAPKSVALRHFGAGISAKQAYICIFPHSAIS